MNRFYKGKSREFYNIYGGTIDHVNKLYNVGRPQVPFAITLGLRLWRVEMNDDGEYVKVPDGRRVSFWGRDDRAAEKKPGESWNHLTQEVMPMLGLEGDPRELDLDELNEQLRGRHVICKVGKMMGVEGASSKWLKTEPFKEEDLEELYMTQSENGPRQFNSFGPVDNPKDEYKWVNQDEMDTYFQPKQWVRKDKTESAKEGMGY